MEKYGVARISKTGKIKEGMGPKIGYCAKCKAPVIRENNTTKKTCNCNDAQVITF